MTPVIKRACRYFRELTGYIHELPGAKAYYVSPFVQNDRCASTVDFVLLDLLHTSDPASAITKWADSTPIGVGAVGAYTIEDAFGLRHPQSPQSQARFIETQLHALLNAPIYAVFVYRWHDSATTRDKHLWGLINAHHQPRSAYAVVQDLYTNGLRPFAFPAGPLPCNTTPWFLVIGWIALVLTGTLYATSAGWRTLLRRYFASPGFYLDAIKAGRDFPVGACWIFLLIQALIHGCTASVLIRALEHTRAIEPIMAVIPPLWQTPLEVFMAGPWLQVLFFATLYVVYLLVMTLLGALIARLRNPLNPLPIQCAFLVQVNTNWSCFLLLPLIMIIPSLSIDDYQSLAGLIVLLWIILFLFSTTYSVLHFSAITPQNQKMVALLILIPPAMAIMVALLFAFSSETGRSLWFWLHLIIRN